MKQPSSYIGRKSQACVHPQEKAKFVHTQEAAKLGKSQDGNFKYTDPVAFKTS
jgi:hypothetical protein